LLVEKFVPGALALEGGAGCPKGSTWIIHAGADGRERAAYLPPPRTGAATPETDTARRIAVFDLGSTSFTLLVADVTPDGHIVRVAREREMLRLGAAVAKDARIPDELLDRAVDAARRLRREADRAETQEFVAVATSAIRDAKNGRKLAERISRALGCDVEIVSGDDEARLFFSGLRRRAGLGEEPTLGLDLGGGSLELAVGNATTLRFESMLQLGVTRLHGELGLSDPIAPTDVQALRARVVGALDPIAGRIRALRPVRCIAAGGTARALARILLATEASGEPADPRGLLVSADDLEALARRLARSTQAERVAMPGMDQKRSDLLPAGAIVLASIVECLALPGLMICDWGLREGVILATVAPREEDERRTARLSSEVISSEDVP
jgi:exopolyphosphatase/guanosine-5'-triphosphate,3'-diphosphate pyrophosphatase